MQKATIYSLAVMITAAGLLLGGNVRADGSASVGASQDISSQINVIRQKIATLNAEIQRSKAQTTAPVSVKVQTAPVLTQAQLNAIAVKVAQIKARTEEIKAQVRILLEIRAINLKIAAIKSQIAAMTGANAPAVTATAQVTSVAQSGGNQAEIDRQAKIAQIKQQIAELSQEYKAQNNLEGQVQPTASDSDACQGDSCQASSSNSDNGQPVTIQVSPNSAESKENQNQGFWESIGNFFRKVFTF